MELCGFLSSCSFYRSVLDMPQTSRFLKEKYCAGTYTECARYLVYRFLGARRVPDCLNPDDILEACHLLDDWP